MKSQQWKPRKDILIEYIGDEEIEAVVLNAFDLKEMRRQGLNPPEVNLQDWKDRFYDVRWKVLDWETAMPFINECECFYVWTRTRVFFIGGYDGSTWITDVPRHPVDCRPYIVEG